MFVLGGNHVLLSKRQLSTGQKLQRATKEKSPEILQMTSWWNGRAHLHSLYITTTKWLTYFYRRHVLIVQLHLISN